MNQTYKLLIVDDEMPNIRLLERLFRNDFYCLTASSGADAIKLLEQHDVAVVITDQRMPGMTGLELLKRTAELRPHMVRIMLTGYTDVEALVEAINTGLVYMYVTKPWNNDDLKLRVNRAVQHYENLRRQNSLAVANERLTGKLRTLKAGFVRTLLEILRTHDEETYEHSCRVSQYAAVIGRQMGLTDESCEELSAAAMLHELQVICGEGRIAAETTAVTGEEFRLVPLAVPESARILSLLPEFRDVADTVRFQTENYDGSGNPRGLIGDQIPISARILRVAKAYDRKRSAATNGGSSHAQVVAELGIEGGKQFDPKVVSVLAVADF